MSIILMLDAYPLKLYNIEFVAAWSAWARMALISDIGLEWENVMSWEMKKFTEDKVETCSGCRCMARISKRMSFFACEQQLTEHWWNTRATSKHVQQRSHSINCCTDSAIHYPSAYALESTCGSILHSLTWPSVTSRFCNRQSPGPTPFVETVEMMQYDRRPRMVVSGQMQCLACLQVDNLSRWRVPDLISLMTCMAWMPMTEHEIFWNKEMIFNQNCTSGCGGDCTDVPTWPTQVLRMPALQQEHSYHHLCPDTLFL